MALRAQVRAAPTIRLDLLCCSDEGNMTLPRAAGIVGLQIRNM